MPSCVGPFGCIRCQLVALQIPHAPCSAQHERSVLLALHFDHSIAISDSSRSLLKKKDSLCAGSCGALQHSLPSTAAASPSPVACARLDVVCSASQRSIAHYMAGAVGVQPSGDGWPTCFPSPLHFLIQPLKQPRAYTFAPYFVCFQVAIQTCVRQTCVS